MGANKIDINSYQPKSGDSFYFDNNVWIYIFEPLGNYNLDLQKKYSNFLAASRSVGATIFINSMILSEFSNRILRFSYDRWKGKSGLVSPDYKKDFIPTQAYKDTVEEITIHINKILRITERGSDNFNAINMTNVLTHLKFIDFNDSYMIEMARLSQWKIVTDDGDFVKYQGHSIDIITPR